jgi:ABC-2 type transport system permease protein
MPEAAGGAPLAGAWDLLRPKVQMARHRVRRRERGTLRRVAVGVLLGGAFWYAAFRVALRLLRYFRSAEDIGTLLAVKLLSMILLSFGSILLLSNTVAALSNFFLARDLDQLAAAPVRAGALYRARLAETLLHSSWMVGLLLVPLVAAYGVAYAGGWWFGAVAVLVLFPFLLLPAALGSAVTLGLVNLFPARRTRDLLSVISALAVAGLALLFRAARPEQLARPEGFRNFMEFVASLDAPSSPWLPSEWVSEALLGFLSGAPAWGLVARLWGAALGLAALGQWLHGRGWVHAFSLAQEGGHRAQQAASERPWGARWLAWLGPLRRELVLKELRVFARDSTQWSQLAGP